MLKWINFRTNEQLKKIKLWLKLRFRKSEKLSLFLLAG